MDDPIYLDYNATTPLAPEVLAAMTEALASAWGNPSSSHAFGKRARQAIETARGQVASLLGCLPDEVVFTGGGTESDNAALVGVAEARAPARHLVTSTIEHEAVEESCRYLERRGLTVTRLPVNGDGVVDAAGLEVALRDDTALVSVMHANNETGAIQPIAEIAAMTRSRGIPLHTDAAQSVGKIRVRVDDLGVDLLTVAGHKLYGPKGVGVLYIRHGTPFEPFLHGAGHESGRRAGTENVPHIVGLGAACALAEREMTSREAHLSRLRDRLESELRRRFPDLVVHAAKVERLPNTLHAAIPGVDAAKLLSVLHGVATAAGAACHTGAASRSDVLEKMGVDDDLARATLRLTVGRPTTEEQVVRAAEQIARAVAACR